MSINWETVSSLATGAGTLVLAVATFASVRSANRSARIAERSMMESLRPVLMNSRLDDPPLKINFRDGHWIKLAGGQAHADATDEAIYLAASLRNAGTGIAVMQAWRMYPGERVTDLASEEAEPYHHLTRDIYIAPGDVGFFQGALRDPAAEEFTAARKAIEAREMLTVQLMYSDHEGGQRAVTQLNFYAHELDDQSVGWFASTSRHWNLDRENPR